MIPGSIELEDGIQPPTWSVLVKLGDEVLDEEGKGPVVGVGLQDRPIDLAEGVHRHDQGKSGTY